YEPRSPDEKLRPPPLLKLPREPPPLLNEPRSLDEKLRPPLKLPREPPPLLNDRPPPLLPPKEWPPPPLRPEEKLAPPPSPLAWPSPSASTGVLMRKPTASSARNLIGLVELRLVTSIRRSTSAVVQAQRIRSFRTSSLNPR